MDLSKLVILDVGHGNCSLVLHGRSAVIVDAPARPVVAQALDELGVDIIEALLISHADSDHLSGAISLLMDSRRPVRHVYVNGDNRSTDAWLDFRRALATARKSPGAEIKVYPSLSTTDSAEVTLGETTLHILHPTPEMCLAGQGGKDLSGFSVDANNMSVVVLIEHDGERICLLAADANQHSLDSMLGDATDLRAPILVFPHHGGRGGKGKNDHGVFASNFVKAVDPEVVLFSLGRGMNKTPRPEVISGVRRAIEARAPYIACTQLSKNCSADAIKRTEHVDTLGDGIAKGASCAGTLTIPLVQGGLGIFLDKLRRTHAPFVGREVASGLCVRT